MKFSLTLTDAFVLRVESWPKAVEGGGHEVASSPQELRLQQRGAQHVFLHQRHTQFP